MTVALPLALIGGMALVGGVTEHFWVRVLVPSVVLLVVPLLLADRLLPSDPSKRRPGLVRDVVAGSWTAAALFVVGASGSVTAEPLRAEAERHDAQGWTRAAYLSRWMAGPEPEPEPAPIEVAQVVEAAVEDPAIEAPSAAPVATTPEPAPAHATEAKPEPGPTEATAATEDPREYSPSELFSTYAPAVVSIKIDHGGWSSGGTGFFVDADGTLATNHHVIDGARQLRVKLFDGTELDRVELLTSNADVDLALLRIDPEQLTRPPIIAVLGDSEAIEVGEPVSVIGNPLGLDHTLTNGIVSARRIYQGERYIQMSAPISPGNSGGPVFDRHGRVIGVSVAQMIGGQNLNLAVPVSQLRALIAEDYPNRRSFGASSW
ncbi:MAG TPA: trypsin-like peptidase domain-containing protein [Enhygromyxa sp.]|nr:trypsin-like peptidase domain-containing protein [Enhygromyxa sp.]